jgi:hypothetical protein
MDLMDDACHQSLNASRIALEACYPSIIEDLTILHMHHACYYILG